MWPRARGEKHKEDKTRRERAFNSRIDGFTEPVVGVLQVLDMLVSYQSSGLWQLSAVSSRATIDQSQGHELLRQGTETNSALPSQPECWSEIQAGSAGDGANCLSSRASGGGDVD